MPETIVSEISKNYAKALLDVAIRENKIELYFEQLNDIIKTLDNSDDFRVVMSNSSISTIKKIEILNDVFGGKIDNKILNFLKVLVEKNRFKNLRAINTSFIQMNEAIENKTTVEIISPIELNEYYKERIISKLQEKLRKEIQPKWSIDKSIIAGLVYKFEDYVIDTSIQAKLKNLRKTLKK